MIYRLYVDIPIFLELLLHGKSIWVIIYYCFATDIK